MATDERCELCQLYVLQEDLCPRCQSLRRRQGRCRTPGCTKPADHGTRCWVCWKAREKYGAFTLRRVTTVQRTLQCGCGCGRGARARGLSDTCYRRAVNARKRSGTWPPWAVAAEAAVPRPRLVRLSQLARSGDTSNRRA